MSSKPQLTLLYSVTQSFIVYVFILDEHTWMR
jgi:hypothetical protein